MPGAAETATTKSRLLSLDAFRGIVVAFMILVNNAGGSVIPALGHAQWHGLTFADVVFPSFVFIIGVGMALAGRRSGGFGAREWRRFAVRIAVLFALGVLIDIVYARAAGASGFDWNGVLQRIALASLIAAPFSRLRASQATAVAVVLLAVHTALLLYAPFPGGHPGDLSHPANTFPAYVDRVVLGERGGLDPENLFGTVSAAGGMLLGVAAGCVLARQDRRTWLRLAGAGVVALGAGWALSPWLPVNKRLWTATFVLVATGIDLVLLAVMHRVVDGEGRHRAARALEPLGRNALVLYVGSTLLAGLLLLIRVGGTSLYVLASDAARARLGTVPGALLFAVVFVALWYGVAVVMYRRRIFVRL